MDHDERVLRGLLERLVVIIMLDEVTTQRLIERFNIRGGGIFILDRGRPLFVWN